MKTQNAHAHEDRLLDFAYDELPRSEALVVEQHVQGCSRCTETLRDIRGVRGTMAHLPRMTAPDAGLESLLAYAQQAARRSAVGSEPAPRWWRRLLAPALSMAAVGALGVVVLQVKQEVPVPASALKQSAQESRSRSPAESAPAVAAAPPPPQAAPRVSAEVGQEHARFDDQYRQEQRAEPLAKALPSAPAPAPAPLFERKGRLRDDQALAGSAGGFPARKEMPAALGQMEAPGGGGVRAEASSAPAAPAARAEAEADFDEVAAPKPLKRESAAARGMAAPTAPAVAPTQLLRQADRAARGGDREQEVVLLREALTAGARGVDVLSRLCRAEAALGHRQNAIEACTRVVDLAPGSSEAQGAQRLLEGELRGTAP